MHRPGHRGVALGVIGILATILPVKMGVVVATVILLTDRLPDKDMTIPLISHRGYSHTLVGAAAVATPTAVLIGSLDTTAPIVSGIFDMVLPSLGSAAIGIVIWFSVMTGFISHILADLVTVGEGEYAAHPFAPFSDWECGVKLCRADSSFYNYAFMIIGFIILIGGVAVGALT